jgi:HK97 family phage prohead protease
MTLTALAAPFEVKASDAEARTFEGLASTWERDTGNDVIHKGAFARTLDHWKSAGGRVVVPLIDQHAYQMKKSPSFRDIVGKLVAAEERPEGLWTRYQVARTAAGDDLLTLVKEGMVTGLSIGYQAVPNATDYKGGVRHLKEVKLREVSVVIFPMNEGALVDPLSVKSFDELSAALRDGALSDEQKDSLRALLAPAPAVTTAPDAPAGLAPDDPQRVALEETLRAVTLRSLGTAA